MPETVLLVGNGINNISNDRTWEALLILLHDKYYDKRVSFEEIRQKPFPLLYEQIALWQLKKGNHKIESELKKLIASETEKITSNEVHAAIALGKWKHIITANYEFNLMKDKPAHLKNEGCVTELMYSVFRNFNVEGKTHWHIHGDAQNTNSINLGYEHYCGQLQRMREYVTGSYKAKNKLLSKKFKGPLVNRPYLENSEYYSWMDFFFRDHTTVKIVGLRMELEELDLWWLLTYRAKIIFGARKGLHRPIANKIQYFIPAEFTTDKNGKLYPAYKNKKMLMEGMDIEVIELNLPHSKEFYLAALQS